MGVSCPLNETAAVASLLGHMTSPAFLVPVVNSLLCVTGSNPLKKQLVIPITDLPVLPILDRLSESEW